MFNRPPESCSRYFTVMKNVPPRIANLFLDIFNNMAVKLCVEHVRFALVVKWNQTFSLEFAEVGGCNLETVGPCIYMEQKDMFICGEDEFQGMCKSRIAKAKKNIGINENQDAVGKLHIPKQDLSRIRVKKYRAHKSK